MNLIFNWSGGKDSAMALHRLLADPAYTVCCLLTTISEEFKRISMHGVREELLRQQVASIGLPLEIIYIPQSCSMQEYDEIMQNGLKRIVETYAIEGCAFGDIFLEDLKVYRETQLFKIGLKTVFPLWKMSSSELIQEFIDKEFRSQLVCVNGKYLSKKFLGREIDRFFLPDLPANVDPCGENGEYHSFVYAGPLFKKPITFTKGEIVEKAYTPVSNIRKDDPACVCCDVSDTAFYFLDLMPLEQGSIITNSASIKTE